MSSNRPRWIATVRYFFALPAAATLTLVMMLSALNAESSIRGYIGEKVINMGAGQTTCWKGSGTNNPAVAGCHVEIKNGKIGRTFAEACDSPTILIDHTPGHGSGKCPAGYHEHGNDVGRPSRIDCNAFCGGAKGKNDRGRCVNVPAPAPCGGSSAICRCN